ncbi:Alpha-1,3-mannosyl-glycoprotein 4-beta-N-acetylglucosaminyltransferase A, partial [Operophtera brumata]
EPAHRDMRFKPNLSNRWFLYSMFCLLIMLVFWTNFRNYNEKISILQEKMRLLEQQHHKAEHEINNLQATLNEKFNETYQPEWSEKNLYYEEIMAHLKNISEGFSFIKPEAHPEPLQADFVYSAMPHLMDHPKARYPAFQILSPRKSSEVDVVIGIPTVKRSLIDHMTTDQLARTLIVVSIGEATDLEYVARTTYTINSMFEPYFGQLIEVISPTKYWYPDFANMEPTLGDSHKRTQWRTKQNLDAIFLMSYAQSKGTYYLMLEDDNIMKFAASETISKPNWVFIDFSAIGGIGKFIRVDNLRVFSAYVQILHKYMPIDWLIELYLASRVCGIGNNTKNHTIERAYNGEDFFWGKKPQ